MKLTVKTIKGETFKIDVEPFNTVNYFIVMSFCNFQSFSFFIDLLN